MPGVRPERILRYTIEELLADSGKKLESWAEVAGAWQDYLKSDLAVVIETFLKSFSVQVP